MSINPVKKLQKEKARTINDTDSVIKEVTLLLQNDVDKESEALRKAGLVFQLDHTKEKRSHQIERQNLEKEYQGDIFSEEEIKTICLKYDLRFLSTRLFIGKLDNQVGLKVKEFIERNESEIGNSSDSFMIMAPPKAFKLGNKLIKAPRKIDPVLFYKVPKTNKYILIWKWGKDFSFLRRLSGIYHKTSNSICLGIYLSSFSLMTWMLYLSIPNFIVNPYTLFWMFVPAILSMPVVWIFLFFRYNAGNDDNWDQLGNEYLWDKYSKRSF